MNIKTNIRKVSGTIYLRVPAFIAKKMNMKNGDEINLFYTELLDQAGITATKQIPK